MFPGPVPPRADEDTAPIEQVIEEATLGQTELDSVVKAQSSAPQVVERMVKLEECLWSLAKILSLLPPETRQAIGADVAIEQAKLLLLQSKVMDHNLEVE